MNMFKIFSTCKGGGYHYCRTNPPHPKQNSKGLYPLHRIVMENKLGRLLLENELVHHKDENKLNDNESNLKLISRAEHTKIHRTKNNVVLACSNCGKKFSLKPHFARLRLKRSNYVCCSRSCSIQIQHRLAT